MTSSHYKRPFSVLVVVYAGSSVLLMKRNDMQDFWQSVTGTIESFETPRGAALRELEEETGIKPCEGVLSPILDAQWFKIYAKRLQFYPPGVEFNYETVFSFELNAQCAIELSREHCEYKWYSKAQALSKIKSQTNFNAVFKFVPN